MYDASARGAKAFRDAFKRIMQDIDADPEHLDNPVLDRLAIDRRSPRNENPGSKPAEQVVPERRDGPGDRLAGLLKVIGASRQNGPFVRDSGDGNERTHILPSREGKFEAYRVRRRDNIEEFLYVAFFDKTPDFVACLADIRILMQVCSFDETNCKFVIAVDALIDAEVSRKSIANFVKLRTFLPSEHREWFELEIWDLAKLSQLETMHGLRISHEEV